MGWQFPMIGKVERSVRMIQSHYDQSPHVEKFRFHASGDFAYIGRFREDFKETPGTWIDIAELLWNVTALSRLAANLYVADDAVTTVSVVAEAKGIMDRRLTLASAAWNPITVDQVRHRMQIPRADLAAQSALPFAIEMAVELIYSMNGTPNERDLVAMQDNMVQWGLDRWRPR